MIKTILVVGNECFEVSKEIAIPFPLAPGMEVNAGEPYAWNHMRVLSSTWHANESVLVCVCDWIDNDDESPNMYGTEVENAMKQAGWADYSREGEQ